MPGNRASEKVREALWIAAMLLLVALVHLPWIRVFPLPVEWKPPADTFLGCVKTAFAGEAGAAYAPTAVISLAWDYFTTGAAFPRTYRYHSLFGLLCQSAFLWLFLRRFRLPRIGTLFIVLFCACNPWRICTVLDPQLRCWIAAPLFCCMALWCATWADARHPLPWMILCASASFIALGASPWCALLLAALPACGWFHHWQSGRPLPWKPLLLPEATILLTALFVFTRIRCLS